MKLECCWDRSNVFLESPPPDSEIKLKICLMKGDTRFTCDNQSTEIEQLEGLISGLEGEELIWLGRRNQEEVWNMEDKIIEILEISRKKQPEAFNPLEGNMDNLLNVNTRQDIDITDMLWNILSQCESYAELSDSLNFLFKTILTEDIRPFVYSGNQSNMATLLRNTLHSGTVPDLSGAKPLHLLLEMGVEKLKRDSSHYLLSSDLASKESLDPYLSNTDIHTSLIQIKRLHRVVEIAFACQTYISLTTASVKSLVLSTLSRLKDESIEDRMVLDFNLQASDVKIQLETGRASLWRMTCKNDHVTTSVLLQVERPDDIYPIDEIKTSQSGDDQQDTDPHYYIVYHTSIKQY